jgi:hypothetical protein
MHFGAGKKELLSADDDFHPAALLPSNSNKACEIIFCSELLRATLMLK